jgi:DNA-binding transcriptional regulator YdaS (Cro superfamily)
MHTITPPQAPPATPLDLAIEAAGGVGKLADLLGVRQNVVSNWRLPGRGVPRDWLPAIERATGIRCEQFDSSVTWMRDTAGRVTHCVVPVAA